MKVLTIKNEEGYFRFTDEGYSSTTLHKASVFVIEDLSSARDRLALLRRRGEKNCAIYLLTITEEVYTHHATAHPARP